jgi:hypothetical protein
MPLVRISMFFTVPEDDVERAKLEIQLLREDMEQHGGTVVATIDEETA